MANAIRKFPRLFPLHYPKSSIFLRHFFGHPVSSSHCCHHYQKSVTDRVSPALHTFLSNNGRFLEACKSQNRYNYQLPWRLRLNLSIVARMTHWATAWKNPPVITIVYLTHPRKILLTFCHFCTQCVLSWRFEPFCSHSGRIPGSHPYR